MLVKRDVSPQEENISRVWEEGAEKNFGLKWDELEGDWREMHHEELHNLCSSPLINRMMR
jgi:hypothetical protein